MSLHVLAINPGSTSTKIAWFTDGHEEWRETVRHDPEGLSHFPSVADQFQFRLDTIAEATASKGASFDDLSAVAGRGGLVEPVPGGTYLVDDSLLARLRMGKPWEHASNLGGILADAICRPRKIPAFIVDPVAVDEMIPMAKLTGLKELPKVSLSHTLNVKATVRRAAADLGKMWDELNFVVAHVGGGITVCTHEKGRMTDLNNANDFGPFSPERSGGLPAGDLIRRCLESGLTEKEMLRRVVGGGGLVAYTGTSDVREVKEMAAKGDRVAKLAYEGMAYWVARDIGAMAVALSGKVDAILLTGGVAYDGDFVTLVQKRVQWIAPVLTYPGEDEMPALAEGAFRVLRDEEKEKIYSDYATGGDR
ncbi:MAG: butyrate kinase [Synergistaceae bacterium]|nr:butyrate kinase [Synergistota bacterium]NLM71536.1 butyrate kinase [Synergistaceae bacterium]